MENDSTVYVGLDVHKESITVAYALGAGQVDEAGASMSDIHIVRDYPHSPAKVWRALTDPGMAALIADHDIRLGGFCDFPVQ